MRLTDHQIGLLKTAASCVGSGIDQLRQLQGQLRPLDAENLSNLSLSLQGLQRQLEDIAEYRGDTVYTTEQFKEMATAYLACALWTAELDDQTPDDICDRDQLIALSHCHGFSVRAGHLLENINPKQAGHDLWLARNTSNHSEFLFGQAATGKIGDADLIKLAKQETPMYRMKSEDGHTYLDRR
jgi:hypothetical protein